jgi:hypothetical protein
LLFYHIKRNYCKWAGNKDTVVVQVRLLNLGNTRTGSMAQAVQHLLCKCKALSSNPSPTKKRKRKRKKDKFENIH